MSTQLTAQIEGFAKVFPSELWWEKIPDGPMKLADLLANVAIHEDRFRVMGEIGKTELFLTRLSP